MAVIELICKHSDIAWHILAGNHDIASYDAPTAIAPLAVLPNVSIYEKPDIASIGGRIWRMIPYTGPDCSSAIKAAFEHKSDIISSVHAVHYAYTGTGPKRPDMFSRTFIPDNALQHHAAWFFGHEHGSAHEYKHLGSFFKSVGSFCDFDFGSGSDIYHDAAIIETGDPGFSHMMERIQGPVFTTESSRSLVPMTLTQRCLFELRAGATPLYMRVSPDEVDEIEMLKRARIVKDYAVHVAENVTKVNGITIAQTVLGGPIGSYAQAVAQELDDSSYGPEDQAEIWDLCSRMMRMK